MLVVSGIFLDLKDFGLGDLVAKNSTDALAVIMDM